MLTTDIRIWGAVIVSLLAPAASFGQESVKQSMDLEFRIRIAGDRARFQVGEIIPVELEFKSATPGVYQVSLRNYDRSGRLGTESFYVTPSGRDPLKSYFSHGVLMFGGLSSGPQTVTAASTRIQEDLNEWIALDRPGHYSLYVQSGRVSRIENKQVTPVDARSNTVEFDVVAADPEWQRQVLSSAKAILDDESSAGQEKLAAIRNLRFLGSEESVRELVHRLGTLPEGNRWEAKAGLLGTVHRDLAVREMERQMSDPDVVVSYEYVSVLASLKMEERYNARPPFPRDDQEQQKKWREREAALEKEDVALQDSLFQKAADWLSVKRGRARSEMTLAFLQRQRGADTKLSAEDIASAFAGLSEEQQERALSFNSERFRVTSMVEPLKKLVAQPRLEVYRLRDTALRTLYETDASEGRPEILKEIGHPHVDDGTFTVTAQTLGLLPERVMPELDELLLSRLGRGESKSVDLDAHLLARYASDAIVDRAKAAYEQRRDDWTCVSQDGFLLYFLRTDADYAVRQMARRAGFCLARSLEEVTRMGRWPEVEPSVIRDLRHADWKGRDAADTLKKYGSLIAKDAI